MLYRVHLNRVGFKFTTSVVTGINFQQITRQNDLFNAYSLLLAASSSLYTRDLLTDSISGLGCSNSSRTHLYGLTLFCRGVAGLGEEYNLKYKQTIIYHCPLIVC